MAKFMSRYMRDPITTSGYAVTDVLVSAAACDDLIVALQSLSTQHDRPPSRGRHAGVRHLLERCDAVRTLARSQALRSFVDAVLSPAAFAVRGLFFDKTRDANWLVAWHQDTTIAVKRRTGASGFGPWSVKQGVAHVRPPEAVLGGMLTISCPS
jgi:hypothetical protein